MARQATGQVVVRPRARGRVYGLRFRAYGERLNVTLGMQVAATLSEAMADFRLASGDDS
jgi:hypothetical protein